MLHILVLLKLRCTLSSQPSIKKISHVTNGSRRDMNIQQRGAQNGSSSRQTSQSVREQDSFPRTPQGQGTRVICGHCRLPTATGNLRRDGVNRLRGMPVKCNISKLIT